jgi:hypothetical protein
MRVTQSVCSDFVCPIRFTCHFHPPPDSGGRTGTATSSIRFENTVENSRIKFALKNSVSRKRYTFETMAGGVALFDYNNDGLLDIFFTNGAAIPSLKKSDPSYWNRLFRNNSDGTFTDVTEKAGLQGVGYSMGVAAGDYDNDGFVDLYVTGLNHNHLFTTTEMAHSATSPPKRALREWFRNWGKPGRWQPDGSITTTTDCSICSW